MENKKVYVNVYSYSGIVDDVRVFNKEEDSGKDFEETMGVKYQAYINEEHSDERDEGKIFITDIK
jgi:hypothetical protein